MRDEDGEYSEFGGDHSGYTLRRQEDRSEE